MSRSRGPRPLWKLGTQPDPRVVRTLQRTLNLPAPLCRLLAIRGHEAPEAAKSFLRPLLASLHDPGGLLDADVAARRLARAISEDEVVVVHGDYDMDGIAAAALLTLWIRALGGRAEAIVPDRARHGYDLSAAGVARAAARGARVLVTVDCGIAALDPVLQAVEAGMDVIVSDHHTPGPVLPAAHAVVNPNRADCPYPNKYLCGAGVAFKVGQLVAGMLGRPADESWQYLDLVALATIADQVALQGENRVLARYGLRALADTSRPGLRALMERAGVGAGKRVDSAAVAFALAPRINAAGRVGDAEDALRLLLTMDPAEARALARTLEHNNNTRKDVERRTTEEVFAALEGSCDPARDRGLVVAGDGWHPGVIGIVASRVVERFHLPAVVIALDEDGGRGSARSIPAFDLYSAIAECAEHLDRFGGHHQAAGMDISRDRVAAFRDAFQAVARRRLGTAKPRPVLAADTEIALHEVDLELNHYLSYLGPFGRENPDPVFVTRRVRVAAPPRVLNGGHLKFRMLGDGRESRGPGRRPASLSAIGFGLADKLPGDSLQSGPVDVAFTLLENTFRGATKVEARVLDVRPAE